ncbi:hypothetical protein PSQ40_06145 [Curvibacter sp. HBC61]|uniref:Uncharacterized protein n=1 Tax=Curvibacter cyanobacteriorum TaxID=3026422 RepID=A0ABT5MZD4_9BURK|nr:hypothetical protein [Curvibacter sp. HBC61]MDD0838147.1 hypothetical protein [Curvibacter sp. HBC61]
MSVSALASAATFSGIPSPISLIASAVSALYGMGSNINDFIDRHIEDMQSSANKTISTTGQVLEAAKFGFGLGYLSSVTIIAVGQCLLGNTFAALGTVATAATISNPIAMTCGAVGAILYGWNALSDAERSSVLDTLAKGLGIGVELIRSLIAFVINTAKSLFSSPVLKDLKVYVASRAELFGKTLSDVTRQTVDILADAAQAAKQKAIQAYDATAQVAQTAGEAIGESFDELTSQAGRLLEQKGEEARQLINEGRAALKNGKDHPDDPKLLK